MVPLTGVQGDTRIGKIISMVNPTGRLKDQVPATVIHSIPIQLVSHIPLFKDDPVIYRQGRHIHPAGNAACCNSQVSGGTHIHFGSSAIKCISGTQLTGCTLCYTGWGTVIVVDIILSKGARVFIERPVRNKSAEQG